MAQDTQQRAVTMLAAEGLEPGPWSSGPHVGYEPHAHAYDKVIVCTIGSLTFWLPELTQSLLLDEGDRIELPHGTLHAALVGPAGVTCLEAQLPAATLTRGLRRVPGWARAPEAAETAAAERT